MHASAASFSRTAGGFSRSDKPSVLRRLLQPVMLLALPCALSILLASGARAADIKIPLVELETTTEMPLTTTAHLSTSQTKKQYETEETSSRAISTFALSSTSVSASIHNYTRASTSNDTAQKYLEAPSENGLIIGASVGTAVFLVAVSAVVLGLLYSQGLIGSSAKAFTPVATQSPPV